MATSIHFAHLTDIHISENDCSWSTIGPLAERLFAKAIDRFNTQDDLDFVLITGDVLDHATVVELDRFLHLLGELKKPWHFVPGNHDGFIDPEHPEAFKPHEAIPRIDPRMATPFPETQHAYWSRTVGDGIQLIGLDSRVPDDWSGEINTEQMAWLLNELDDHRHDLVLIAIHHPLHHLTHRNIEPLWSKFICRNGMQIEALLDAYPNVKLVMAGHHHANQIQRRGSRLHVNTASLSGYPCVYRTIRVKEENSGWRIQVHTHSPSDEETLKQALDMLRDSSIANRFSPGHPSAWIDFVAGRPEDLTFDGVLD